MLACAGSEKRSVCWALLNGASRTRTGDLLGAIRGGLGFRLSGFAGLSLDGGCAGGALAPRRLLAFLAALVRADGCADQRQPSCALKSTLIISS
jgi:hypothetical protein